MYKIYFTPVEDPPIGIYSITKQFTLASVAWDWSSELKVKFPEDWDEMHKPGLTSVVDGAIRLWIKKYHTEMYDWLEERAVDYIGVQSSEYVQNNIVETICIRMHREEDLVEFRLRWC